MAAHLQCHWKAAGLFLGHSNVELCQPRLIFLAMAWLESMSDYFIYPFIFQVVYQLILKQKASQLNGDVFEKK